MLIDGDRFIPYLVFSGLFDEASCGDLKKAIELCTVNAVPDVMVAEIENLKDNPHCCQHYERGIKDCLEVIHKYTKEQNNDKERSD